jgi:hypothetical protein
VSGETSNHQDTPADQPADQPFEELDETIMDTRLDDAREVLEETRRRLAGVPAEVVITNHVMGLYELAAIHLGANPPDLGQAALAIDAVGCLVEGLGERIGPEYETLNVALSNIRLAFVQIKNAN